MSTNLAITLSLARARTLVLRDVDEPLGSHHGLGLNDLAVLLELQAAPGQKLRRVELARRLAVTTSGIARQLGPLERIGLVSRESNPTDARLALVVLTPRGAEVADEAGATAEAAAATAPRPVVVQRREGDARRLCFSGRRRTELEKLATRQSERPWRRRPSPRRLRPRADGVRVRREPPSARHRFPFRESRAPRCALPGLRRRRDRARPPVPPAPCARGDPPHPERRSGSGGAR